LKEKADIALQFSSPEARTLAWRIICRNYPGAVSAKFDLEFKSYLQRINPLLDDDAMVDYREERRTTPTGVLIEIKLLKQSEELTSHQIQLLTELENYLYTKFKAQLPNIVSI
jgi:hypothetical protein